MDYIVRKARFTDLNQVLSLLDRLVEFTLPIKREKNDLLREDIDLIKKWGEGQLPSAIANVVVNENDKDTVCGFILVVIQNDNLSKNRSAQIEILVSSVDGESIGQMLLLDLEAQIKEMGIKIITLDVYTNNLRAMHVYNKVGYLSELVRCVKHL